MIGIKSCVIICFEPEMLSWVGEEKRTWRVDRAALTGLGRPPEACETTVAVTKGVTKWGDNAREMELQNVDWDVLWRTGNDPELQLKTRIWGAWKQENALLFWSLLGGKYL